MRIALRLAERHDWVKVFDPRGGSVFVATPAPPPVGADIRVDLTLEDDGPRVILSGTVLWRRDAGDSDATDPAGCSVGLSVGDREKVNFLNGFVRGGLINRRERRRLPLRLPVTYGGLGGPEKTFTSDINEEGLFLLSGTPLPAGTVLHFVVALPARDPFELRGRVTHAVPPGGEELAGMGVCFLPDAAQAGPLKQAIDELENSFLGGRLPDEIIS